MYYLFYSIIFQEKPLKVKRVSGFSLYKTKIIRYFGYVLEIVFKKSMKSE